MIYKELIRLRPCCGSMAKMLKADRYGISARPHARIDEDRPSECTVGVDFDMHGPADDDWDRLRDARYCPWCGTPFCIDMDASAKLIAERRERERHAMHATAAIVNPCEPPKPFLFNLLFPDQKGPAADVPDGPAADMPVGLLPRGDGDPE